MNEGEGYKLLHIFAGNPRTLRGRPCFIKGDPKGKKFLYCNGNSIFIRDIENPTDCDVYTQHAKETSCAAYSPSGFYICSGDASGRIRIWDTVNKEHILKYEYTVLGGAIKDIDWSEDSKRIAFCGEGREYYGGVINWDTGTSCGSVSQGPTKSCNNISMKPNRPYRVALGCEDYSSFFYEGPPFKFKDQSTEHTNFVNCVRYSPDGSKYVTAGADGKCFIYDGKTGELLGELNEVSGKIHNGGVYGVAWSPDSKQLLTCSADKTVKVWSMDEGDYKSNKETICFTMGNQMGDMQVGCAWIDSTLISISLNGNINYLDCDNPSSPKRIIKGHNKAIYASCLSEDKSTLFTASFDGLIYYWNLKTGISELVHGKTHTNQVQNMSCSGSTLVTCGMDDTVRFISIDDKIFKDDVVSLPSQPQRIAAVGNSGLYVVVCSDSILLLRDGNIVRTVTVKYEATCVAVSSALGKVAVGSCNNKVTLYNLEGDQLKEIDFFLTNGNVTDIKFSPDDQYLALCTGKKQVKVVTTANIKEEKINAASHAVKVNAIAWAPNSLKLASCGVDGVVYIWDVEKGDKDITIRGAHAQSVDVTTVQWADDNTLITTGRQDCSVRVWQINH